MEFLLTRGKEGIKQLDNLVYVICASPHRNVDTSRTVSGEVMGDRLRGSRLPAHSLLSLEKVSSRNLAPHFS